MTTDMPRCETCRHWSSEDGLPNVAGGLGHCQAAPQLWDSTEWVDEDGDDTRRLAKPQYAMTRAFVTDASDYHAALLTRPDFGCIAHDSKEE